MSPRQEDVELIKISELSRRSGVAPGTIKHYLREGLLETAVRTYRNMAYYDARLVDRILAIKELQRTRFLPLKLIKEMLDRPDGPLAGEATTGEAISRVLAELAPGESRTRRDILADGYDAAELDWLVKHHLVTPVGKGDLEKYSGDDLALVQTLLTARKAGLRADMLPLATLDTYGMAIEELVRLELEMFRSGVLPRAAGENLGALAEAAATLSERLIVLLRRKLLLPTLSALMAESLEPPPKSPKPRRRRT